MMSTEQGAGERVQAVLFADISGSTRLYETLGDDAAHRAVDACLAALRDCAAEFDGRLIKYLGDAVLCVFDHADAAISAASEMQSRLDARRHVDPTTLAVRIGVAYGSLLERTGDVFGDTVNVAARVVALATANQILTTQPTVDALSPLSRNACRVLYAIAMKGVEGKVVVHEVVWKADAELTLLSGMQRAAAPEQSVLRLTYRGNELRVDPERGAVHLGRDPQNDLVVASRMASRRHAQVRFYEGNFVLVDESANGTYVRFETQPEVHLRREETILVGSGLIGLGASTLAEGAETLAFVVQQPVGGA